MSSRLFQYAGAVNLDEIDASIPDLEDDSIDDSVDEDEPIEKEVLKLSKKRKTPPLRASKEVPKKKQKASEPQQQPRSVSRQQTEIIELDDDYDQYFNKSTIAAVPDYSAPEVQQINYCLRYNHRLTKSKQSIHYSTQLFEGN